ncbi:MAG: RNA polymerase sigma-70 factor [Bacteroidota bacterium]
MPEDDAQLQKRFLAGDIAAYEALFHRYYAPLTGYAVKYVHDLDTARDLVQDLFVRLYQNRATTEIRFSFKAYCYQAVRNACLKQIEKNQRREKHHADIARSIPQAEDRDLIVETEEEYRIYRAIEALPERCRRIFWMNRMEGKKNGQIAEELGISKRTVETQISKALRILREKLLALLLCWEVWGGIEILGWLLILAGLSDDQEIK